MQTHEDAAVKPRGRGGSSTTFTRQPSPKAHWSAGFCWTHMKLANMTQAEFLRRAGFPRTTFQRWWNGTVSPRADELEACLGVFGYRLKAAPIKEKKADG